MGGVDIGPDEISDPEGIKGPGWRNSKKLIQIISSWNKEIINDHFRIPIRQFPCACPRYEKIYDFLLYDVSTYVASMCVVHYR